MAALPALIEVVITGTSVGTEQVFLKLVGRDGTVQPIAHLFELSTYFAPCDPLLDVYQYTGGRMGQAVGVATSDGGMWVAYALHPGDSFDIAGVTLPGGSVTDHETIAIVHIDNDGHCVGYATITGLLFSGPDMTPILGDAGLGGCYVVLPSEATHYDTPVFRQNDGGTFALGDARTVIMLDQHGNSVWRREHTGAMASARLTQITGTARRGWMTLERRSSDTSEVKCELHSIEPWSGNTYLEASTGNTSGAVSVGGTDPYVKAVAMTAHDDDVFVALAAYATPADGVQWHTGFMAGVTFAGMAAGIWQTGIRIFRINSLTGLVSHVAVPGVAGDDSQWNLGQSNSGIGPKMSFDGTAGHLWVSVLFSAYDSAVTISEPSGPVSHTLPAHHAFVIGYSDAAMHDHLASEAVVVGGAWEYLAQLGAMATLHNGNPVLMNNTTLRSVDTNTLGTTDGGFTITGVHTDFIPAQPLAIAPRPTGGGILAAVLAEYDGGFGFHTITTQAGGPSAAYPEHVKLLMIATFDDDLHMGVIPAPSDGNTSDIPATPKSDDWPATAAESTAAAPTTFVATVTGDDSLTPEPTAKLLLDAGATYVQTTGHEENPILAPAGGQIVVSTSGDELSELSIYAVDITPLGDIRRKLTDGPVTGVGPWTVDIPAEVAHMPLAIKAVSADHFSGGKELGWYVNPTGASSGAVLELVDPAGVGHSNTDGTPIIIDDPAFGRYAVSVTQPGDGAGMTASVSVLLFEGWYGTTTFHFRWNVSGRVSAVGAFVTDVVPTFAPTAPVGSMPKVVQEETSVGSFSVTDTEAATGFSWYVADHEVTDYNLAEMHTTMTFTDTDGHPTGTVSVAGTGRTVHPTFVPAGMWAGTGTFYLCCKDNGTPGWSPWTAVQVEVMKVNHPPTMPVPSGSMDFDEDGLLAVTFSCDDIDYDPTDPTYGSWEFEISHDAVHWASSAADGTPADIHTRTNGEASTSVRFSWVEGMSPLVRVCGVTPRQVPDHYVGTYDFYVRVKDTSNGGGVPLYSPINHVFGTIHRVAHSPSAPWPNEMPTTDPGVHTRQTFTVSDPDPGNTLTFAITGTPSTAGTFTLAQPVGTSRQCHVDYTPAPGFSGRYTFSISSTDSTGRTGPATLVRGAVGMGSGLDIQLQRIVRSGPDSAVIEPLCILTTYSHPEYTEALGGPGSARFSVEAGEIGRRAAALGMEPGELVEQGIEVVISAAGSARFLGEITNHSLSSDGMMVDIDAIGIGDRFGRVYVEDGWTTSDMAEPMVPSTAGVSYTGREQGAIFQDLLTHEQAKPYGNMVLTFANDIPDGADANRTITFASGDTLASCFDTLSNQLLGCDFWVTADRVFTVAPQRCSATDGGNHINRLIFTERNCVAWDVAGKWDDFSTYVRVEGTGAPATRSNEAAMAKYGRHGKVVTGVALGSGDSGTLAQGYVDMLSSPLRTAVVTYDADPKRLFGLGDFGVGDFASIELHTLMGLQTFPVRITGMTVRLVEGTSDRFHIECELERCELDEAGHPVVRQARTKFNPDLVTLLNDSLFGRK